MPTYVQYYSSTSVDGCLTASYVRTCVRSSKSKQTKKPETNRSVWVLSLSKWWWCLLLSGSEPTSKPAPHPATSKYFTIWRYYHTELTVDGKQVSKHYIYLMSESSSILPKSACCEGSSENFLQKVCSGLAFDRLVRGEWRIRSFRSQTDLLSAGGENEGNYGFEIILRSNSHSYLHRSASAKQLHGSDTLSSCRSGNYGWVLWYQITGAAYCSVVRCVLFALLTVEVKSQKKGKIARLSSVLHLSKAYYRFYR